jgi:hypothetical protein
MFSDLIKARQHKYIKRVPKAGGGFTYFYREQHGGGVALKEHMKAGAAFRLTHNGQEGHFHIKALDGERLTVEHDESGASVEMTRDELAALLRAHHAPALERQVKQAEKQAQRAAEKLKEARRVAGIEEEPAPSAPSAPAPKRERPNNFETMPESEGGDYSATDKALGAGARSALRADLSRALAEGDTAKAAALYERRDQDQVFTGAPRVDTLTAELIKGSKVEQDIDGSRRRTARGRASDEMREALEQALAEGRLRETITANGATVYTPGPAAARRADQTAWSLTLLGGQYEFIFDDYAQTNTGEQPTPTYEDIGKSEEREPARKDAAKVNALLEQLSELVKGNPALALDPRVIALLGSQTEPKREGREMDIILPGLPGKSERQRARYVLIEAGDAIPSHDPLSFSPRQDYPEGIQERAYHQERGEQLKVLRNVSGFNPDFMINTNPDATNGAPIITPEGVVLGGNSRTMTLQLVYANRPDHAQAYKDKLREEAAAFGFSPADVDALKAPMLVRVYDPPADDTRTLAQIVRAANATKMQGMEGRIKGRALASQLSQETLRTLKATLARVPPDYSINRFLTKPSNALTDFLTALRRDKIITDQNAVEYIREDGTLNGNGRELIMQTLIGYILRDEALLASLDFSTYENLTVAVGKLAAQGLSDQTRKSLADAIAVYNYALTKDIIKARQSPEKRDANIREMLFGQSTFDFGEQRGESLAAARDIRSMINRVSADPLANSFLKLFVLNPTPTALEDSIDEFIKMTETPEMEDFFAAPPLDYQEAADKLGAQLGEKHNLPANARGAYRSVDYEG